MILGTAEEGCGGAGPKVPGGGIAGVWNGPEGGYPAEMPNFWSCLGKEAIITSVPLVF